jgi:ubiquinone/menaquinone biosynthesis C-methylase UbiE
MEKTQKELAFVREQFIQDDWTKRFTDLADKHMDLRDSDNMLYINAGTGNHALAIFERFGEKTDVFASCENEDLLKIARDKAAALGSPVDFSTIRFEDDAFDAVLADASLVRSADIEPFIENVVRVARTGGDLAILLPSAGSFGEVFSLLWEVMFEEDLNEDGTVENLISQLPTLSHVEDVAKRTGMVNINTQTANELFEYENGNDFITSPLVADFLMPMWLDAMEEEQKERVTARLAQLIDKEDADLTFRFTLKATLLTGEKE